ncbi:MAG: NAD(P)H-hydrate dehydratase [Sphingomonadales bacterium]|jgi:hydroxyethylthiazole kinase-like uncharacterized protein yjeF
MIVPQPGLPLLTAAAMRAAEAAAIAGGTPALVLMERASAGAAAAIRAFAPCRQALVLAGPGNNGGDGYGVALALAAQGVAVTVAALAPPVGEPAATMAARWRAAGGAVVPLADAPPAPLMVDALFGTGLARALADDVQAVLNRLRGHGIVVALDIASGLDADTGALWGDPLPAAMTVSFGAAKPGHVLGTGLPLTGRLVVVDIGVDTASPLALTTRPRLHLPFDAHKYARGAVLVVAGQQSGAAGLAALAALRAGAGAVTMAGGTNLPALAVMQTDAAGGQAMLADKRLGAVVIGPGLGADASARDWLARLLQIDKPLVIDAGALALLPDAPIRPPAVLTPHEGEFTRQFGAIGADRVAAVQAVAARMGAVVLLKGPATIIAAPDGRVAINTHASATLATAGSGDVLAGIIAALLAQGLAPFDAATTGAWLHGDAGCRLGPGAIADDIIGALPDVLAALA